MFKKLHFVIMDPKYSSHLVRKTDTVVKYLKTPSVSRLISSKAS